MLAFDRVGSREPLVLLHGTNSSREVWSPLVSRLAAEREVIAFDLPAHGASPPTSFTPPDFATELAAAFDELGLSAPAVVGHSVGGWTALELTRRGRAGAVLALAPAGLWRRRSPFLTDLGLRVNWRLGQMLGGAAELPLRSSLGRRLGLSSISARPEAVSYDVAVAAARGATASKHFPEHFRRTRVLRFTGGREIPSDVPVQVVWGDRDRVALAGKSRFEDELPAHAHVETWTECGHAVMWDRPDELVAAALRTTAAPAAR